MSFVHLHTHSHYSVGRAVPSVEDLVMKAAREHMPALALTDNNTIAGMYELWKYCKHEGVHPIIGCELDVLPSPDGVFRGRTHRIVLLVRNETGYRNLVWLLNRAHTHPPDLPRHVRFVDLEAHLEGLIVLTGSPRSELYALLREGNAAQASAYINRLRNAAEEDGLVYEVMDYPHPRTRQIMDNIRELAEFAHQPAVATQNVHYLEPEDVLAYCALMQHPRQVAPRWPLPDSEMPTRHFATAAEMDKRFAYHPDLLEQTLSLAERCVFDFPPARPQIPVPDFDRGQDAPSVLWDEAVRGATERYGELDENIKLRLNQEYGDIRGLEGKALDLSSYFLLLRDTMRFLSERDFCRGTGMGKWSHSLIAYALGIIETDPMAHKLAYEPLRENPMRLPVFPIEVSTKGMEKLLEHLQVAYGKGNVAAVGRVQYWKRTDLYHHLCKWAGLPRRSLKRYPSRKPLPPEPETEKEDIWREVPSMEPELETGPPPLDPEVEEASEEKARAGTWVRQLKLPEGKSLQDHASLAEVVHTLHPCPRRFEVARGEYCLSREPIPSALPVTITASGYPMPLAEARLLDTLRMPRVHFECHSMLNVLENIQGHLQDEYGLSVAAIPPNDEAAFRVLALGFTNGIAALHGITAKSLLRSEQPANLRDLIQVMARTQKRRISDPVVNKSDCISAAILAYRCAWLKANYPIAFMRAVLTQNILSHASSRGAQRPRFQILLREARRMQIEVLPPNINFSLYEFDQEHDGIRTGLMAVQGLGMQTYKEIERVRASNAFQNFRDFCQRTGSRAINQKQIVNLIKAGAFDELEPNRNQLLQDFDRLLKNARNRSTRNAEGGEEAIAQLQLFGPDMFDEDTAQSAGQQTSPPTMGELIRYERESLGFTISHDQIEHYDELIRSMRAISPFHLNKKHEGQEVFVAGFIDHAEREGALIGEDTEFILDLEGAVVRVPPEAVESFYKVRDTRLPVLIEGVVQAERVSEYALIAREFFLLKHIRETAAAATSLQINLGGLDRKTSSAVRALLKSFRGPTPVQVQSESAKWWDRRSLGKAQVFLCPPLYRGLTALIPERRIRAVDQAGNVLPLP